MINILHITPHMGGGVGKVISSLVTAHDKRVKHKIVLLEEPIKTNFINKVSEGHVEFMVKPSKSEIESAISENDIVIIHWWHHPKISRFLYNLPSIPLRIIIWTHISNLTVPALNSKMLLKSDRVLFTTEASYGAKEFKNISKDVLKNKTGVVYGCGGFDDFPKIVHKTHDEFNIGYLGLVDFSKMHPDFVGFCKEVNIPMEKFILVGDAPARQYLDKQLKDSDLINKFKYVGYVEDIKKALSKFDVFGYPLMPYHTCTTENAILEAMAAEVPPILLNQLTEKYIIENGKTGFLVSDKKEYGEVIRYLYNNPKVRRTIGENARNYVLNKYTLKNFLNSFFYNCETVMQNEKSIKNFKNCLGKTPAEWFFSCLGDDYNKFKVSFDKGKYGQDEELRKLILSSSPLIKQKNKASIFQYVREFPYDTMLNVWMKMFEGGTIL